MGYGFGGGITYDPLGGRPGGDRAQPGKGGVTIGIALEAGVSANAGAFGVSGQASGSRGYDFGAARQFNDPSFSGSGGYSPDGRRGFSFGGSATVQGSIWGR